MLYANSIMVIGIISIILLIVIPLIIIINRCAIYYIIIKRKLSNKYVHKLSIYIYKTIHYEMNEVYEIYELNDMNRIYEIKNKINDLHMKHYKYNSYSYVITIIEKELILFKEKDLMKLMINDINNQKLLLSKREFNELITMKINGLKVDITNYKNYLREFFKSLNNIDNMEYINYMDYIYYV